MSSYDALLLVSFGGPEGPADVLPFLENVTRGRGVPPERLREVAGHYAGFGGVSPINAQNRELLAALRTELAPLPVYWGNRHWHPMLADTLREMAADGVQRALAFVTSAASSYNGCRVYLEDIARARAEVGPRAPAVDKLRVFFNHPGFVEPQADRLTDALTRLGAAHPTVVFTAHSIPVAMAATSRYVEQLGEASRLVAERGAPDLPWRLVWQSRSGPPAVPWLEPDVGDHLASLAEHGTDHVVVVPVGFVSDHLEVRYDLDTEAAERARALGMRMERAATVGTDPRFVAMVRELVEERTCGARPRFLGPMAPRRDDCSHQCCPPPLRAGSPAAARVS